MSKVIQTIKSDKRILLLLILAILVRIVYFIFEKNSPLFLYPIIDESEYLRIARSIAHENIIYSHHFWHPPFYAYSLGILMKLGLGLKGLIILQQLAGISGVLLLYLSLIKILPKAAFASALIWAVYPLQLFIETKFLSENLFNFLLIAFLYFNVVPIKQQRKTLIIGTLSSLLIITKTHFILFVFAWLIIMYLQKKYALKQVVTLLLISLSLPLVVSFHNMYYTGGHFIFVSSNGPSNLYIGNAENLGKTLNIRPKEWKETFYPSLFDEAGIHFSKNQETSDKRYPYLLSKHLIHKTLKENKNLVTPLKNLLQKSFIVLNSYETPRDFDLYAYRQWNKFLQFSLWNKPIRFPLAFILYAAILFIVLNFKSISRSNKSLLLLLLFINILPSILFFNAFRYRLSILPFAIPFAVLFYQKYFKSYSVQIVHIACIVFFATPLADKLLIQSIPLNESYDFYADGFFDKGKTRMAKKYYTKAINTSNNPSTVNSDALVRKSYIESNTGDTANAIKSINKAIEIDSAAFIPYYNKANLLYKQNQYNEALNSYHSALKNCNNCTDEVLSKIHIGLALCQIHLNRLPESLNNFNLAIGYDSTNAMAFANRGILLAKKGDLQSAILDFSRAILLDPVKTKPYYDRAAAYVNLGKFNIALKDINKIIELAPNDGRAYFLRAMLYMNTGDKNKACKDLSISVQLGYPDAATEFERNCK